MYDQERNACSHDDDIYDPTKSVASEGISHFSSARGDKLLRIFLTSIIARDGVDGDIILYHSDIEKDIYKAL